MSVSMKWNFQKPETSTDKRFGFVALQALPALLDQDRCQAELFQFLKPGREAECCPFCLAELSDRRQATFRRFGKCRCLICGRQFTATSGTPLNSAKLSPAEILVAGALVELGAPPEAIARALGRGLDTARAWHDKLEKLVQPGDGGI